MSTPPSFFIPIDAPDWYLVVVAVITTLAFLQVVGLTICWLAFILVKYLRVIRRIPANRQRPPATSSLTEESDDKPAVAVIMPCKGVHTHSKRNWHSLIAARYTGHITFLFVVESENDPAYGPLNELKEEVGDTISSFGSRDVKVVVSERAKSTTQKITNLLRGFDAVDQDTEYVMFADDDIAFYPDSIALSVKQIESDPKIYSVTGAPLDLPKEGSGIGNHAHALFRMIILVGFIDDWTQFVWGGCNMIRRDDLLNQTVTNDEGKQRNLLQIWEEGGYSDDCITGGFALEAGRLITTTPAHVFPSMLDKNRTLWQYFNFLYRQMFVLDTYSFGFHKRYQHIQLGINIFSNTILTLGLFFAYTEAPYLLYQYIFNNNNLPPSSLWSFQSYFHVARLISVLLLLAIFLLVVTQQILLFTLVSMANKLLDNTRDPIVHGNTMWRMPLVLWLHSATALISALIVLFDNTTNWAGIIYHKENGHVVKITRDGETKECEYPKFE